MGAEYWAGLATGLGWGVGAGLAVALLVALFVKRLAVPPTEPQSAARGETSTPPVRAWGGNQ